MLTTYERVHDRSILNSAINSTKISPNGDYNMSQATQMKRFLGLLQAVQKILRLCLRMTYCRSCHLSITFSNIEGDQNQC